MKNKSVKLTIKHLLFPLTLLVFMLVSTAFMLLWQHHSRRLQKEIYTRVQGVERQFFQNMQNKIDSLSMSLLLMSADETVQKSLRMGKSEDFLLSSLRDYVWKPVFVKLQQKYDLSFFTVLDSERNCLLCLHNEKLLGSKLGCSTLLKAEKSAKLSYGLELSKEETAVLRVVQPVSDTNGIVGYIIMGVKIDALLRNLHEPENVEIIFAFSNVGVKSSSDISDEDSYSLKDEKIFYNSGFDVSLLSDSKRKQEFSYRDSYWRFSTLNIDFASEKEQGKLLVFYDISGEKKYFQQMVLFSLIFALFLLSGILLFLYRLLRRTDELISEQQDIISNAEERAHTEEAKRQMNEKVMTIINSIDAMIYIAEQDSGRILYINDPGVKYWGNTVVNFDYGRLLSTLGDVEMPELRVEQSNSDGLEGEFQRRVFHNQNDKKWYDCCSRQILWSENKKVRMEVIRDITAQKELESRLLQSQKMQSIGKLAGGVAHDFNNMLTVMEGYTELALEQIDVNHPIYNWLLSIRKSVHRSTALTRQLLTFARKQSISPRLVDINETINGLLKMLKRLIGENIQLNCDADKDLWKVMIDPSQIDQVLANLCLNARDAIEGCGDIEIRVQNVILNETFCEMGYCVDPGEYVKISVEDSGCGMSEEIIKNIFEPFFTTKETGKGTGLGLATVYGIVMQNRGFIKVRSIPGAGSCFFLTGTVEIGINRGNAVG